MRLVETVQCRVPPGTTEIINSIAEVEKISPSEVLRRAIIADVEARRKDIEPQQSQSDRRAA